MMAAVTAAGQGAAVTLLERNRFCGVKLNITGKGRCNVTNDCTPQVLMDNMVHISELSWTRVKHPSDVLSIGQEVEVYVIALDSEKHKISLGYRDPEGNPWNKFVATYHEMNL